MACQGVPYSQMVYRLSVVLVICAAGPQKLNSSKSWNMGWRMEKYTAKLTASPQNTTAPGLSSRRASLRLVTRAKMPRPQAAR